VKALPLLAAVLGLAAAAPAPPRLAGCPVFPASNPWNQRVDRLPVVADSATIVASIGRDLPVHADFGSSLWQGAPIGIPFDVVGRGTPRSRVVFDYADESDRGPYPIPAGVHVEGGGDRHAILADRSSCRLYELYALRQEGGRWHAGSGRRAGPPPTRPACRSCPGSRATTRSCAARSGTRSASRLPGRDARTSGRRGTSRATPPTRVCRRWVSACA